MRVATCRQLHQSQWSQNLLLVLKIFLRIAQNAAKLRLKASGALRIMRHILSDGKSNWNKLAVINTAIMFTKWHKIIAIRRIFRWNSSRTITVALLCVNTLWSLTNCRPDYSVCCDTPSIVICWGDKAPKCPWSRWDTSQQSQRLFCQTFPPGAQDSNPRPST